MFSGIPKRDKKTAQLLDTPSVSPGMEADHLLMLKVREGDQKAFKALFEKYKGPIMSYVNVMVGIKGTSEEITQDVFLRVYRFRETYSPTAKFTTWLWTIARNASIDHLRSAAEVHSAPLGETEMDEFESPVSNAEKLLIENSEIENIQKCMDKLPASQKEILTMQIFGDLSYEEIEKMTGQTVSSIKSLLFRARTSLLQCLEKNGGQRGK